ncbi:MAG: hypothetical protein ACTHJL_05295 [Amnibacterium sp.]
MAKTPDLDPERLQTGWTKQGFDRILSVQRPAVLAHLRSVRRQKPDATPAEVIAVLEQRYLAAVTTAGAAAGAAAVLPGVGTAASIAISGAETVGFLEASALFAQSLAELHGIAVEDPERSSTLVMALMLGPPARTSCSSSRARRTAPARRAPPTGARWSPSGCRSSC